MGIRTDPGYRLYTGNSLCFPSGKTPKKLYATITGVKPSSFWPPFERAPISGTLILENNGADVWYGECGIYQAALQVNELFTMFFAGCEDLYTDFAFVAEEGCIFGGGSLYEDDGKSYFFGGSFTASPRD